MLVACPTYISGALITQIPAHKLCGNAAVYAVAVVVVVIIIIINPWVTFIHLLHGGTGSKPGL